jgi:hypothetical protein
MSGRFATGPSLNRSHAPDARPAGRSPTAPGGDLVDDALQLAIAHRRNPEARLVHY